jgi:rubredoxin
MSRATKLTCPVCRSAADVDRPDLPLLGATCRSCGWHFTVRAPTSHEGRSAAGGPEHATELLRVREEVRHAR